LFFIAYGAADPAGVRRRGQQQRDPDPLATITAGSQPISTTGAQLFCLIACAATATAMNPAASPEMRNSQRFHGFMPMPPFVKRTCHRQVSFTGRGVSSWLVITSDDHLFPGEEAS
jgi:hypothetical protein